jgi:hypothetical protein
MPRSNQPNKICPKGVGIKTSILEAFPQKAKEAAGAS